jgi:carboxypeptidase Q
MSLKPRVLVILAMVGAVTVLSVIETAGQALNHATLAAIRDEGLNHSEVMAHIGWLSDVYGPRVTGSPAIEQARAWTTTKLREWGLSDVHEERFAFGYGWSLERFHAHMVEPQIMPFIGYPKSWSSSTDGTVTADVMRVDIRSATDFERYRGGLSGKIVLPQPVREVRMLEGDLVHRMSDAALAEASRTQIPSAPVSRVARPSGQSFNDRLQQFYLAEGVVAVVDRGSNSVTVGIGSELPYVTQRTDGGTIFVGSGGPRDENVGTLVPSVTLAVEHYNRMVRILDRGVAVRMELHLSTRFHSEVDADQQLNAFNLLAEIPGTDLADEVVMLGAHFDTTHAGTGATDNAAGVAAMMEVMRILQAVDARPRRTIRLALWGAEEQGLLGSREYVRRHFGDPATALKRAHAKLSGYFNIDNGAGRLRGIWLQENFAVASVFEEWIDSMQDLGVTTMGPRRVTGTDHESFDDVGLPGFQFMQDRLEYNSRTHHSNMDLVDRVQRDDVVQMAVVAAIFAYNSAMRDERLPRKTTPMADR